MKKQAGGSFTHQEWIDLKKEFDFQCLDCGQQEPFLDQKRQSLTRDHVIPLVKGGTNFISNIQPLCLKCNDKKHDKTVDFRVYKYLVDFALGA